MKTIHDDIYQRFHGFKSVKRGYKTQGESDWYYVDPRYKDDDERGKIDVASENSINPRLNGILEDDLNKNPEDYYIWRTKKDEKVRGKHAEREGKIFNKHIPPEGGNPGEDYNCRCWAEPYKPEKITDKQQLVDLSGLDMFKEQKAKNTKSIKQYAENDKSGVMSDAVNYNPNYISDEELYQRMWNNIKEYEGYENFPYLDTKGNITIGAGANVNNWNVFKNLNVTVDGVLATEAQKRAAYQKLRQKSNEKDAKGNYVNRNKNAKAFKNETNLRLSDQDAYNMAFSHMKKDLAHLRREFPDFDTFPNPLKEVLLDIQYNVIGGVNENNWPKLYKAIREKNVSDKDGIVENVNRPDVSEKRNNWAKQTARSIKF